MNNNNNENSSLTIQKAFVNNSKEILAKDNLLDDFNKTLVEFYKNPEYGTFKKIQDIIKDIDTQVKDTIKELLIENGLKSSSGPAGKFTLVELSKINYNEDETADRDKRVVKILKLKKQLKELEDKVKDDVTLFNKDVKGVLVTKTPSVRFYKADKKVKGKEIVVDHVDFEVNSESN